MGILALSFFVVGLDSAIYGAVGLYVFGIVLDNTTRSFDRRKQAIIITNIPDEVSAYINLTLHRGVTRLDGMGGYSKQPRPVLLTLLEPRQAMQLKKFLAEHDPQGLHVRGRGVRSAGQGIQKLEEPVAIFGLPKLAGGEPAASYEKMELPEYLLTMKASFMVLFCLKPKAMCFFRAGKHRKRRSE
jgi:Uncharacterized conserved protein